MITSLLPAQPETRTCLRLHMRGLHPVYLVQCLFLLYSLFLCVVCAAEASFDKKGLLEAVQLLCQFQLEYSYSKHRHQKSSLAGMGHSSRVTTPSSRIQILTA